MANKTLTSMKFPGLSDTYLVPVVAQTFSSNNTYAVGTYCTYQGQIYKCTTAVETAGDFDASDWTAVNVSDDLAGLISAEVTRSSGVEGSLSNLTTTAKGNLVAAINEVDANADANAAAISSLNSNLTGEIIDDTSGAEFKAGVVLFTAGFQIFKYVDLTFSFQGVMLPTVRLFTNYSSDLKHGLNFGFINTNDGGLRQIVGTFTNAGRYLGSLTLSMGIVTNATGTTQTWTDISSSGVLKLVRAIGYPARS